jgi:hypothetical protein
MYRPGSELQLPVSQAGTLLKSYLHSLLIVTILIRYHSLITVDGVAVVP